MQAVVSKHARVMGTYAKQDDPVKRVEPVLVPPCLTQAFELAIQGRALAGAQSTRSPSATASTTRCRSTTVLAVRCLDAALERRNHASRQTPNAALFTPAAGSFTQGTSAWA